MLQHSLSFNLKEQLSLLHNVYEVKQSTPTLRSVFTMCDSTRQDGLVTLAIKHDLSQTGYLYAYEFEYYITPDFNKLPYLLRSQGDKNLKKSIILVQGFFYFSRKIKLL